MKIVEAIRGIFTAVVSRSVPTALTRNGKKVFVRMAHKFLNDNSVAAKEVNMLAEGYDWRGLTFIMEPPVGGGPFVAVRFGDDYYLADTSYRNLEEGILYIVVKPEMCMGECVYSDKEIAIFKVGGESKKFRMPDLLVAGKVVAQMNIKSL